jgi:hypothetical protein
MLDVINYVQRQQRRTGKVQFVPSSELKSGNHSKTITYIGATPTFWELELFAWYFHCKNRSP